MDVAKCEVCGSLFEITRPKNPNRFCSWKCRGVGVARARGSRRPHSAETRKKIADAQRGKVISPEQREKMSLAHRGKPWSAAQRAAIVPALPRGETHPRWKGDAVGYDALHSWLNRKYSKQGVCEECGARPKRTEWANVTGVYQRAREHWRELCVACHRRMDGRNPKRPVI